MIDWEVKARELTPLTLKMIRHIKKDDCITIILIREIAFNELRREWQETAKEGIKDEFLLRKVEAVIGNNADLRDSVKLNYKLMRMEEEMDRLRKQNYSLNNKTIELRSKIAEIKRDIKLGYGSIHIEE